MFAIERSPTKFQNDFAAAELGSRARRYTKLCSQVKILLSRYSSRLAESVTPVQYKVELQTGVIKLKGTADAIDANISFQANKTFRPYSDLKLIGTTEVYAGNKRSNRFLATTSHLPVSKEPRYSDVSYLLMWIRLHAIRGIHACRPGIACSMRVSFLWRRAIVEQMPCCCEVTPQLSQND